ncbi:hypothetical protein KDL29_07095 [bacterium]|nr:hypothetical protein [bacterium]
MQSYRIYAGNADSDYPAPGAPSSIQPLAELPLEQALGEKSSQRLSFSFMLPAGAEGQSYWVRPVLDGSEGRPSNIAGLPPSGNGGPLTLLAVSPQNIEPGLPVQLEFSQPLEGFIDNMTLGLGDGEPVPLPGAAVSAGNFAWIVAPLLAPGSYEFFLEDGAGPLDSFMLEIEAGQPGHSAEQFRHVVQDSFDGIKVLGTQDTINELWGFQDETGIQAGPLAAELAKLDELFMVFDAWIADELDSLSPAEQAQLLAYLENSGCIGILEDMSVQGKAANKAASAAVWGNNFEHLYYDAQSARIGNSSYLWDLLSVGVGALTGGGGFAIGAVSMMVSLQRHIIDLAYPTDVKALFVEMPRLRLRSDTEYEVIVKGHFYSERAPSAGETLGSLVTSVVGALPLPSYLKEELLQVFSDYVIITGANLGVTLALDEVLPTEEDPDNPYEGHVDGGWIVLDPFLYSSDNPKDIFFKLGQLDPERQIEEAVQYYRTWLYGPSNRSQDGDFITGLGGGYKYRLGER